MITPSPNPKPEGFAASTVKPLGPNLYTEPGPKRSPVFISEEQRQMYQADFEKRQRQGKVESLRQEWNVWKRHSECDPIRSGEWGDKLTQIESKLGSGFLIGICGVQGNGKTQLGVELMKVVTENLKSALFSTAVEFFTDIKDSWKTKEDSETEVKREYRKPSLLVIDEFGKSADSEWQFTQLFDLLNNRYGDKKDTLIISNQKKDDFLAALGPSIASRMLETGGVIVASWPSFRREK